MKRFFVLVFCVLGILAQPRAQDAGSPPNTASLAGMVVKEPGDQPLKKVLLHLIAEDQKQGGNYTADTDSEGRFRIEKIQPGRYRLLLEKTGFHPVNVRGHLAESPILSVQAGQEINDLLLQMLPSAVITGRVVDEDGDPLSGYGVSLLRKRPGKAREPELAGEERTNDLGEYRFPGLFPGQYLVAVVPLPDIRNFVHSKDSPDTATKPDLSYLTTYYPGTSDAAQAGVIDLRAADEMPVNFTLVPSRSYRIRGIVTGIPANQKPMVQLLSKGVNQTMNGTDVSADGQFEIRGVAPGSYLIMVFAGSEGQILSAHESVSVVAADVEGVKLVPARPFTVSGHVRFEGRPPKDVRQCSASLSAPDELAENGMVFLGPGGMASAKVDLFGNFQWTGVNPGTYVTQFNCDESPDTFLKSVTLGSSNADTGFSVSGPASVELVVSSRAAMLEGVVLDKDKPASNATVVAVPEEKYRKLHDRFGLGSTDQNGRFAIHALAPGSYTVFAWQDLDDGLYYDAGFLKAQESNGASLKIEEGSRQKVELKLSMVSEEWQ